MSFDDEIARGFDEATSFAGEAFTLSDHSGIYLGVFNGDSAEVGFEKLQGYENEVTNSVSVAKSSFGYSAPPAVDEVLKKSKCKTKYNIVAVQSFDGATWDLSLVRIDG